MLALRPSLAVLVLPATLAACSRPAGGSAPPKGAPATVTTASSVAPSGIAAEVDGQAVSATELETRLGNRLMRIRQQEYELRVQALDELIAERLIDTEARRLGLSREALLRMEVDLKASPSPADAALIYDRNRDRFPGKTREEALAEIEAFLGERARAERRAVFERELRAKAKIRVRLEPPRTEVPIPKDASSTGPADAPVTIVEFTDYQCPYCHRAQATIDELLARYSGKVRFVHRDFPLDGHPGAVPAARASRCAGEQGRFWEYHRNLMTARGPLDDADLKARAASLGLEPAGFASCLSSSRHDAAIQKSAEEGAELGVNGTPAYFINGRMVSGARPLVDFTGILDDELARGR